MHKFVKGDSDYHELLNDNFDELGDNLESSSDKLTAALKVLTDDLANYAKKTEVKADIEEATTKVYQKTSVGLGYGVTATLTRIGNIVNMSINSNQTSSRPDGRANLTEMIPVGYRPISSQVVDAHAYVADNLNADRYMLMFFYQNGSISSLSKNMTSAPLTIALAATWLTSDAIPT